MVEAECGQPEGRIFNFAAGPCTLPYEILKDAEKDLVNYKGSGMSIMEMSHRGKEYTEVYDRARENVRKFFQIPDNYKVLFLQGGAMLQFASVPMNLLRGKKTMNYLVTGAWGSKAFAEAKQYGDPVNVWEGKMDRFPGPEEWKDKIDPEAAYFHYTSNETIGGIECRDFPFDAIPQNMPIVCDMSSDFASFKFDVAKYGMIYGGAQKNLGPAGLCLVIVREDLLGDPMKITPTITNFTKICKEPTGKDMLNTPSTFPIYMMGLHMEYMLAKGGAEEIEKGAETKAKYVYDMVEGSNGYYRNPIRVADRSRMNLVFRIQEGGMYACIYIYIYIYR